MNKWLAATLGILMSLSAGSTWAIEDVTFNGFLTVAGNQATNNAVTQDGNITGNVGLINDTRFGLQVTAKINPEMDVTAQLLSRAKDDNFNLKTDWAFFTYHLNNHLKVRAGKLKIPTFMVSDYLEVGYAYPWLRPPQEVYSAVNLSALSGADILGTLNLGRVSIVGQLQYGMSRGEFALVPQEVLPALQGLAGAGTRPAPSFEGGSALCPYPATTNCATGSIVYTKFTADNFIATGLTIGTDAFSLRGAYSQGLVGAPALGSSGIKFSVYSVGGSLDWRNIVAYSEYYTRKNEAPLITPNQKAYYVTGGYRIGKFLPHYTYAKLDDRFSAGDPPASLAVTGIPLYQVSHTVGVRYELGTSAALKLEAQKIDPRDGTRGMLLRNPQALAKPSDTINIYSVGVDVVF